MAGADYGLRDDVNLNGAVHLLSLAYGVAGIDIGAAWFPLENEGWQPTLSVGPWLFAFASTKGDVDDRITEESYTGKHRSRSLFNLCRAPIITIFRRPSGSGCTVPS